MMSHDQLLVGVPLEINPGNGSACAVEEHFQKWDEQEVKVIWQKAPHGGPIPRLGVTPGGRKLYHWIPG